MDDKEYEMQAAALYEALGEISGAKVADYGPRCRLKGKSGSWHQIDVLVEQSNGLQVIRTAIECKYWNRKVPRNVISNIITTVEDTGCEKGVVISKEGFTSGAIALAKQNNISLVEMREPKDADWAGKIKTIQITVHYQFPEFSGVEFIQDNPPDDGSNHRSTVTGQDVTILEPGKQPRTLDQVLNEASATVIENNQTMEIRFLQGTTLKIAGVEKTAVLDAIRFQVEHHVIEKEIVIDASQAVELIVTEVFQEREFVISPVGRVSEITDRP